MILINCLSLPPEAALKRAIETGDLQDLEAWFIGERSPGYSFQTIVDYVAEERSRKSKAKRAPSAKTKTRKATTTNLHFAGS